MTTSILCRFFAALLAVFVTVSGWAVPVDLYRNHEEKEEPLAQSYSVAAATSEIKVNGVLDEQAWEDALVMKLLYEYSPGENVPPPVESDFLITFDNNKLYMAFKCYDPDPSKIRAHLMDRDSIDTFIQDDHVVVMIDFFNDNRRGFQFRANPLGVQADANFSEMEGYEDFSWDAIWASAGKTFDWGYAVEIAIPFNQLRFPQTSDAQTWGISAERSYPRNVRHRISSHKRRRDLNCIICQFNKVTGFQGMKTGLNMEIDPTLTAVRTDHREEFPQGEMKNGKIDPDPGLSFRWGITPNLILNATVNPDFSQVEADVAQLDVNTRFALRYPEKRPFFLEGADFFLTPLEAVFTRTVADPDGGLKFTGKFGKNAFGIFGAYDRINNLLFPANQGSMSASLDQDVGGGVFRYRRDIGESSAVGVLYTGRVADDYYNHVTGIDGFVRLSRTNTFSLQYLHSATDYSEAVADSFGQTKSSFWGNALILEFNHQGRNWVYSGTYSDFSPGFRADFGYMPRVDIRRGTANLMRLFWGDRGNWFTLLGFGTSAVVIYDHEGNLTDRTVLMNAIYQGPLQSRINLAYLNKLELYADQKYELNTMQVVSEIKPAGGLRFQLIGQYGNSVDYNNYRKANEVQIMPVAEINLGRHLSMNFQHVLQHLSYEGEKIFTANLSQARLEFNFNVRCFIRAIVQFLDVSRNLDLYLYPDYFTPKTQTVFTQFLFSYKLNPQTVFFLGYSDNYLGMTGIDITQTDRTFFVKLGYAWTR
jgi:hypothetical protein